MLNKSERTWKIIKKGLLIYLGILQQIILNNKVIQDVFTWKFDKTTLLTYVEIFRQIMYPAISGIFLVQMLR